MPGAGEVIGYSALVCATVIGARFVWVFTVPYVIRALDRRPAAARAARERAARIVAGWSGIRGAVSLAAALALPLETDAGAPLPDRDLILFITFAVILVTLVGQGLTLPALIRRLGVQEDGAEEQTEELRARLVASRAALERLDELTVEEWTRDDTVDASGPSTSSASAASRCAPERSRTRTASRTARSPTSG